MKLMNFNINKITFFHKNLNIQLLFLLFSWLAILISINSGFYSITNIFTVDLLINHLKEKNYEFLLVNLFNSIRWILPLLILPFLIIISYKKIKFDLFNLSLLFLSLYYAIQIFIVDRPVTKFEVHGPQLIDNLNLLCCYLCTILIFAYLNEKYKDKILYFKYILILFILFVAVFIFIFAVYEILKSGNLFLYYNQAFKPGTEYFDQPAPRITGWSRLVLIIFIFYFFFNETKKISKKFYLINIFILLLISFLIIFSQSRGSLIGYVFALIFYLFLQGIKTWKKTLIILLFSSIPLALLFAIDETTKKKNMRVDQNRFKTTVVEMFNNDNKEIKNSTSLDTTSSSTTTNKSYSLSSGRIQVWNKSIETVFKEKKIFGFGPQGDRYVLTKLAKDYLEASWSNNSSNAIVYSIVSGGIIGFLFILLIYFKLFLVFLKTLKIIFFYKMNDFTLISSFVVFCYVVMRSFFENSFAVFGIDFCLLVTVYHVIKSKIYYFNKT